MPTPDLFFCQIKPLLPRKLFKVDSLDVLFPHMTNVSWAINIYAKHYEGFW